MTGRTFSGFCKQTSGRVVSEWGDWQWGDLRPEDRRLGHSVFFEDIRTVFDGYCFLLGTIVEFRIIYFEFYGHYAWK